MAFHPMINHEQCIASGSIFSYVGPDGITYFKCPCMAFQENIAILQHFYGFPMPVLENSSVTSPDTDENPLDLNESPPIASSSSSETTSRECEDEPSRDSDGSSRETSQPDHDSEPEKKKKVRKRRKKKKIIPEKVEEIVEIPKVEEIKKVEEIPKVTENPKIEEVPVKLKRPHVKKIKRKKEEEKWLSQMIEENQKEKRDFILRAKVKNLCITCNRLIGYAIILLSKYDTRCYSELIFYYIMKYLKLEKEPRIRFGSVIVDQTWTQSSIYEGLEGVKLAFMSFDTFYSCSQMTDLSTLKYIDICYGYLTNCSRLCAEIYKQIERLIKGEEDMSKIPGMIAEINLEMNWDKEILKFMGLILTDQALSTPEIEWPILDKIVLFQDIFILSDCTWGTLAHKDKCDKCGATKGTVIYTSCCHTRQVFCKCVCNTVLGTIACQNLASECVGLDMIAKQELSSQEENQNLMIARQAELSSQDKTMVLRIFSKFNKYNV